MKPSKERIERGADIAWENFVEDFFNDPLTKTRKLPFKGMHPKEAWDAGIKYGNRNSAAWQIAEKLERALDEIESLARIGNEDITSIAREALAAYRKENRDE